MTNLWGTMGLQPIVRPGDDGPPLEDVGRFFDPNRQAVTINGKEYYRVGEDLNQTWQGWDPAAQAYLRNLSPEQRGFVDPTYGGVTPADTYAQLAQIMGPINAGGAFDPIAKALMFAAPMAVMGGAFPGIDAMTGASIPAGQTSLWSGLKSMLPNGSASLPESYWNTVADAGGTVSDAAASNAGSFGSDIYGDIYREFAGGGLSELDQFIQGLGPKMIEQGGPAGPIASFAAQNALLGGGAKALGTGAASTLGKLFSGDADIDDYLKIAGALGGAGLGLLGANSQSDALKEISDKYLQMGAPFRNRLASTFEPGYDLMNEPGFANALDVSSKGVLRNLSAQVGNPYDNPGAVTEAQKQITGSLALPQLNTMRSQLGTFGQLGTNQAGTADFAGAQNAGAGYDALGYGLGQLTQPKNDLQDLLKQLGGLKLNTGYSF